MDTPGTTGPEAIAACVQRLASGGLVAFPTETVYGLGADPRRAEAVEAIYRLKGRPRSSPLILHVSDEAMARGVVEAWPERARRLAGAFWPGPMTLVLGRGAGVPEAVCGGGPSVGVRCPAQPLTLALIETLGWPIAGTSANRSDGIAPTRAAHVRSAFAGDEVLVLDGGRCPGGLESTVVSLVGERATVLRAGPISAGQVGEVLGEPIEAGRVRSAGRAVIGLIATEDLASAPAGAVVLAVHPELVGAGATAIPMPGSPEAYAAALYDSLHRAAETAGCVLVEWPIRGRDDDAGAWAGIGARLMRLAGGAGRAESGG